MFDLLENCVTVDRTEDGLLVLIRPDAKYILVNQDEKIHQWMLSSDWPPFKFVYFSIFYTFRLENLFYQLLKI